VFNCLNWQAQWGERKGERRGAAESAAAAVGWRGKEEKEERKGGEERLTGGAQVSARAGKKKREREDAGRRGERDSGLLGRLGRKGGRRWFSFFSFFFFKPHFLTNIHFKLKSNLSNFSQEFYKLFRNHTSNQKPCKPTDDAHTLVVSKFIKLYLIF
jgi:hypothetical protein